MLLTNDEENDTPMLIHRTSSPFLPPIPQSTAACCCVHTQTHYSVSPVLIDPRVYNTFAPDAQPMGWLCFLGAPNRASSPSSSSFSTVCTPPVSDKGDASSVAGGDHQGGWCSCSWMSGWVFKGL